MQHNFFTALDVDLTTDQQVVFQRWNTLVAFAHFQRATPSLVQDFFFLFTCRKTNSTSHRAKKKQNTCVENWARCGLSCLDITNLLKRLTLPCSVGEEDTFPSVIRLFQLHGNWDNGRNLIGRQNRILECTRFSCACQHRQWENFLSAGFIWFWFKWQLKSAFRVDSCERERHQGKHKHTHTYIHVHTFLCGSDQCHGDKLSEASQEGRRQSGNHNKHNNRQLLLHLSLTDWGGTDEKKVNSCFYEARRVHKRVLRV